MVSVVASAMALLVVVLIFHRRRNADGEAKRQYPPPGNDESSSCTREDDETSSTANSSANTKNVLSAVAVHQSKHLIPRENHTQQHAGGTRGRKIRPSQTLPRAAAVSSPSIFIAPPFDPSLFQVSDSDDNWVRLLRHMSGLPTARHNRTVFKCESSTQPVLEIRLRIKRCRGGVSSSMCQLSKFELYNEKNEGDVPVRKLVIPDGIIASGEHLPNECASNLLKDNTSKWLHDRGSDTAQFWFSVKLQEPCQIVAFALTTANDAPDRDPYEFTLEGRLDGSDVATYTFNKAEASRPQACPISLAQELLQHDSTDASYHIHGPGGLPRARTTVVPLQPRDSLSRSAMPSSKVLVCHDMKGGYTPADKFPQNSKGDPTSFSIYHWHLIDIFVYFSHHLVTIPPPGWINITHRHGVQCLGTFITEWGAGTSVCNEYFFGSKSMAARLADCLTSIARIHCFEGWLVNIENNCNEAMVPHILTFLRRLRSNGLETVWYDSITYPKGSLSYQNELNSVNSAFFEAASSIFVNYRWTAGSPRVSAALALKLGRRPSEVFMGVDVWDRGTYGGGGFTTNVAIRAAFDSGCSTAIFAPGFLHEKLESANFQQNNLEYWRLVQECITQKAGHSQYPPIINSLPLYSSFSKGAGYNHYVYGESVAKKTEGFFNLSHVDVLPLVALRGPAVKHLGNNTKMRIDISPLHERDLFVNAFHGSQVVTMRGILGGGSPRRVSFPLYTSAAVLFRRPLVVSYTFKQNNLDSEVCICLRLGQQRSGNSLRAKERNVFVLRGFRADNNDSLSNSENRRRSSCLNLTRDKAFFSPVVEVLTKDASGNTLEGGALSSENLVSLALSLRKEGKSTATIGAILRQKRESMKKIRKKRPWKSRLFVIDPSYFGHGKFLAGVDVLCVPSSKAMDNGKSGSGSQDLAVDSELGELRISQPSAFLMEDGKEDTVYRYRTAWNLQVSELIWSSPETVCFSLECRSLHARHDYQQEEPDQFDFFMKRKLSKKWEWIGRSIGPTFRAMHVLAKAGTSMLVGAIPFCRCKYAMDIEFFENTHSGRDALFQLLEESARVEVRL